MELALAAAVAVAASMWVTRTQLPVWGGAAAGAIGAGGLWLWLRGCAWAGDIAFVQTLLGSLAMVGVAVAVAGAIASIVSGSAGGLQELRTGTFRLGWWWPWLLLAPTLVVLLAFLYWPALQTFDLSTKLARRGAPRTADVCLANFSNLLVSDATGQLARPLAAIVVVAAAGLWVSRTRIGSITRAAASTLSTASALWLVWEFRLVFATGRSGYRDIYVNTVVIAVGTVALAMAAGLAVALLAVRRIRGAAVYRTLLIWPYAVSPPIAGILFFMMFDPTAGIINHLFDLVNLPFPNYRTSPGLARFAIISASAWKQLGYNILFFMAGLQQVPRDQIEAATLDGANAWQRLRHIVMPTMAPITFFLLITNLTYAFFEVYGTIDYLTKGAPAGATNVAIYEIIRVAVRTRDLGKGAAQSVLLFVAVIGLTVWQFRRAEDSVTYGGA